MPGAADPGRSTFNTMIGIGALGAGVLLLFAAYKNVNPLDVVRQVVTTGNLDISKLPKLFTGVGEGPAQKVPVGPGNGNPPPGPNAPGGGPGPGWPLPGGGHAGVN